LKRQKFPNFLVVVQREVFFKGRETLFEYAVCCFSKKKVSLSPLTPLFPKTLTTKPVYSILVRVKKFGKRGV